MNNSPKISGVCKIIASLILHIHSFWIHYLSSVSWSTIALIIFKGIFISEDSQVQFLLDFGVI